MNNKPYTQNEFINKLKSINPNIEVLGEYTSSHSKILVQCRNCGVRWSPQACSLIQGIGCPECGKRLAVDNRKGRTAKKTSEQFIQELNIVNRSVTVVGKYTGSKNKVDCICNVCGYKWAAIPYSLLKGCSCPACAKRERSKYRQYTPESFKEKLYQINPNVELLSSFTKSTERIEVKCNRCGKIWFPKAFSLLQGHGCPNCSHIIGAKNNSGITGLRSY